MGGSEIRRFTDQDSELLVRIVKASQGRRFSGENGEWKEFLKKAKSRSKASDPGLSRLCSDPARHPWTTLAQFVNGFTEDAHKQMVQQMIAMDDRSKKIQKLESVWEKSPAQDLVRLTMQHPRYQEYYSFPSTIEGWVTTEQNQTDSSSKQDRMLSIDCEMVVCDGEDREVVRVCVVDSDCKTVLNMLVKPTNPVTDYLTSITGLTEADLEHVTCNFVDAQTAVFNLLNSNTILVGHSLHNDLKALKIDHLRVIDTSFLYKYRNKPETFNAGLNNLCKAVLGFEFREDGVPHDCLVDATIPMRIVHHALEHGVQLAIDIPSKVLDEGELRKLYCHGIPEKVTSNDLRKAIPKKYSCDIESISRAKNSRYGTTYIIFKSSAEANKTFDNLHGPITQDSYGRPQKTISVPIKLSKQKLKLTVNVRKMSCIDSNSGLSESIEDPVPVIAKRMKLMDPADVEKETAQFPKQLLVKDSKTQIVSCCDHLQEIESLKKQLKEKIEEVQSLQRIILNLSKAQL